jgi:hypothetical protein
MCSNAREGAQSVAAIAAAVAKAVDDLAAAVTAGDDAADPEFAARLSEAWAMISAADPELAARMARYSPS